LVSLILGNSIQFYKQLTLLHNIHIFIHNLIIIVLIFKIDIYFYICM